MIAAYQYDPFATLRERMVQSQLRARGIADERVLAAMLRVPRHEFIPERYRDQAYEDHPLPIGEGQTISQPYIVPIGPPDAQQLHLIRMQNGRPEITLREPCRFVPLVPNVNETVE